MGDYGGNLTRNLKELPATTGERSREVGERGGNQAGVRRIESAIARVSADGSTPRTDDNVFRQRR